MSEQGNIYKKLSEVQQMLHAPRDKTNYHNNSRYRTAEGILENLKPILKKVAATVYTTEEVEVINNTTYVKCTVHFIDIDTKDYISNVAYAKEEEGKGKTNAQGTGASISYARKYALGGLFLIDDGKDSDALQDEEARKKEAEKKQNKGKSQAKQQQPVGDVLSMDELGEIKRVLIEVHQLESKEAFNLIIQALPQIGATGYQAIPKDKRGDLLDACEAMARQRNGATA